MENIEKKIEQVLAKEKDIVSVHLFGSQAKGSARDDSDVDCAILFQKSNVPDGVHLLEMRELLHEELKRDVDLVCLNNASPVISMQIYKYGKLIVNNDQKQYSNYVMNLFTDYFDLKLMRKTMEEDILKRKYYG